LFAGVIKFTIGTKSTVKQKSDIKFVQFLAGKAGLCVLKIYKPLLLVTVFIKERK